MSTLPLPTPGTTRLQPRFYYSDAANSLWETPTPSAQTSPGGTQSGGSHKRRRLSPCSPQAALGPATARRRMEGACQNLLGKADMLHACRSWKPGIAWHTEDPGRPALLRSLAKGAWLAPWHRGRKASPHQGAVPKISRPLHSLAEPRGHVPTSV